MLRLFDAIFQRLDLKFSGLYEGIDVEFAIAEGFVRRLGSNLAGIPYLRSLVVVVIVTGVIMLALVVRGRSIRHGG